MALQVVHEVPQTGDGIGPRHFDERVQVREGAGAAVAVAGGENDADMQKLGRFRKQEHRCRRRSASSEELKRFEHVTRQRMLNALRLGEYGEALRVVLAGRGGPQLLGDVEQLGVREPDERTAQERSEGERIERIGEYAHQGDDVLRRLAEEQRLSGLRSDRKSLLLKRPFVAPQLGARRREERDVAGVRGAIGFRPPARRPRSR